MGMSVLWTVIPICQACHTDLCNNAMMVMEQAATPTLHKREPSNGKSTQSEPSNGKSIQIYGDVLVLRGD